MEVEEIEEVESTSNSISLHVEPSPLQEDQKCSTHPQCQIVIFILDADGGKLNIYF